MAELEPGFPVLLAPCYYSKTDDVCTLSPGALITYSGCSTASHSTFKHLKVTKDGKTIRSKFETVGGLDYKKIKICHFNKALNTKIGRNSYLATRPPRFLLKSGQYSIEDQEDSSIQPSSATKFNLNAQHHPDDPAHSELDPESKNQNKTVFPPSKDTSPLLRTLSKYLPTNLPTNLKSYLRKKKSNYLKLMSKLTIPKMLVLEGESEMPERLLTFNILMKNNILLNVK